MDFGELRVTYVGNPRPAVDAAREVERAHERVARGSQQTDAVIARSAKTLADVRTREMRRSADEFLGLLEKERRASELHAANLSKAGALAATAAFAGLALSATTLQDAFERAASFDALKRGLAAATGSAEEAERTLARLRETAKLPGLSFRPLVEGVSSLRQAGLSAEFAEQAVVQFSNALALSGRGSQENLRGVYLALQQISNTPFLQGDEINQLRERLPQLSRILTEAFGTSRSEDLKALGVTSHQVLEALVAGLERLPRAGGGASNAILKLQDAYDQALVTFGEPLLEPLAAEMVNVAGALERNKESFKEWGQNAADVVRGLSALAESELGTVVGYLARANLYLSGLAGIAQAGRGLRGQQATAVKDFGNGVTVDPNTLRPVSAQAAQGSRPNVDAIKEQQKLLEKQKDLIADLRREILFFGDDSARAATSQRLLSAGVTDLNSGLAQQALQLADVVDRFRDAADVQRLMAEREKETREFAEGVGDRLRDAARDARRRAQDIRNELAGFQPSELFRFDNSQLGQTAKTMGREVKADLDDATQAFRDLDAEAAKLEPFRKRQAAAEALSSSITGLADSLADAARPAKDKFDEFARSLERNADLPRQLGGMVRDARRELEGFQPNSLLVMPADSQRLADFAHIFEGLIASANTGKGAIKLTADEVMNLSRQLASAAASAIDFDRNAFNEQALAAYTRTADEFVGVIERDIILTNRQRLEKEMLGDAYRNLSEAQRTSLRALADDADSIEAQRQADVERRRSLEAFADDMLGIYQGAFGRIDEGWNGMWEGMLDTARRIIDQIANELLNSLITGQQSKAGGLIGFGANLLTGFLGGLIPGMGAGSNLKPTSGIGGLFAGKFQHGGAFNVPGSGGTDSTFVSMLATPGERVEIFPPGRQKGGGTVINNHVTNITVPAPRERSYIQKRSRRDLAETVAGVLRQRA